MTRFVTLALALSFIAAGPAAARGGHKKLDKIDVLTQNQYLGADLTPVISAPDPISFNAALVAALQQISANNYPERSRKLAQLIAHRLPELAGLQEMFRFDCFNIPLPGPDCDDPSIANAFNDHLVHTVVNLAALGEYYQVAAVVNNLDLTGVLVPGLPPGLPVDLDFDGVPDITVTVLDRDVILARPDVHTTVVSFPCSPARVSVDGCNFTTVATTELPDPTDPTQTVTINIERGFVGVDTTVDGRSYRFVNTHLEVQNLVSPPGGTPPNVVIGGSIQAAQATELVALVAGSLVTDPPVDPVTNPIIVGDINSSPEDEVFVDPLFPDPTQPLTPPYTQLAAGVDLLGSATPVGPWADAWTHLPIPRPGYTCCQQSDLRNKFSQLDERIDVVFSLAVPDKVSRGRVLGSRFFEKTHPSRLWPSDHGTVATVLGFE